jgi:hypothetical protein
LTQIHYALSCSQTTHYHLTVILRSGHFWNQSITLLQSQRCWHNSYLCLYFIINTQETHIQLPSLFTQVGTFSMVYTKYIKTSKVFLQKLGILHDSTQASMTRISNTEIMPSHLTVELESNNDFSQSSRVRVLHAQM